MMYTYTTKCLGVYIQSNVNSIVESFIACDVRKSLAVSEKSRDPHYSKRRSSHKNTTFCILNGTV